MPLTPIDIQQKTFGPELRGYNMDEVDDFLDEVVSALKDYDQQIRDAQDRIRALEAEVATRGEDETAISRALVTAQKQADELLADAEQEAERIRDQAQDETAKVRSERDAEQMALTQEIARMRATLADLKRRVIELASSAEADLDEMDRLAAEAADAVAGEPAAAPELEPVPKPWEVVEAAPPEVDEEPYGAVFEEEADDEGPDLDLDDLGDLDGSYDEGGERIGSHEASPEPDESDASPSNSRRPWERGTV